MKHEGVKRPALAAVLSLLIESDDSVAALLRKRSRRHVLDVRLLGVDPCADELDTGSSYLRRLEKLIQSLGDKPSTFGEEVLVAVKFQELRINWNALCREGVFAGFVD